MDLFDFLDALVERFSHLFVHVHRIVAFHEIGLPAAAVEETFHFVVRDARKDGRVVDLIAVQVKDRQNGAVGCGVQEFIGVPGGSERACFRFAVADRDGGNKVGVVENGTERVGDGVAEFAAFVDGAGRFGGNVTGNSAGEGELFAQFFHAFIILSDVGINFAVSSFQVRIGDEEIPAVSRTGQQDHIEIIFFDHAVQVNVDKVLPGNGAPMSDDLPFDLIAGQRFPEQGVIQHIQLCRCEIVRRSPVSINFFQIFVR